AVDGAGNLFIGDSPNASVRKVSPSGIITTVAGNGTRWISSGDGGPATSAGLGSADGVALDAAGNPVVAAGLRIRKISPDGTISTVAGGDVPPFSGSDPPKGRILDYPLGVAVDSAGNLVVAESGTGTISKISASGTVTRVAGRGAESLSLVG